MSGDIQAIGLFIFLLVLSALDVRSGQVNQIRNVPMIRDDGKGLMEILLREVE